jgi:hypothetical protein
MGEVRNARTILAGKPAEKKQLASFYIDGE